MIVDAEDLSLIANFLEALSMISRDTRVDINVWGDNGSPELMIEGELVGYLGHVEGTSQYALNTHTGL